MPFAIVFAPEAVEDLRRLKANVRATMRIALETHLRHQPEKTSRSRIKRLRGLRRPQFGCVLATSGYSMMFRVRPSKFWRS